MGARALTYGSVFAALVFVLGCGQGGGGGGGDGGGSVMDGSVVPDSGEDFPCVPSSLNVEFPANGCDDDGDGMTDEAPESCDGDVAADGDANAFARAIGLCQAADDTHWGLVSAVFTRSHTEELPTDDLKHSILTKYGAVLTPREGTKLGVLGTAAAEESADEPFFTQDNLLGAGKGQPGSVPVPCKVGDAGCGETVVTHNNVIAIKLTIKAPANARGVSADFAFYSAEWPLFVGSEFNDGVFLFIEGESGSGNFAFDSQDNVVDVNNGFFDRCTPGVKVGCRGTLQTEPSVCAAGESELAGTGFANFDPPYSTTDNMNPFDLLDPDFPCYGMPEIRAAAGGSTGWLASQTPIVPGETFTLKVFLWNAADAKLQSIALLDNVKWVEGEAETVTVPIL